MLPTEAVAKYVRSVLSRNPLNNVIGSYNRTYSTIKGFCRAAVFPDIDIGVICQLPLIGRDAARHLETSDRGAEVWRTPHRRN